MCTIAGYLASAGKGLNRGERGTASLCMPHPYRWKGAGWQRDGGPSQLFGLPGDGHLLLALHSCLCHYLYSARFLFVSWRTPPHSIPSVCSMSAEKKASKLGALGSPFNFLFTRERCIDQWGQKNKVHQSDGCKNIAQSKEILCRFWYC